MTNQVVVDRMELLLAWVTGNVAVGDLQTAIPLVSEGLLNNLAVTYAVDRPSIQRGLDDFLDSNARVLVVTGPSGTGKSVASAIAAERWGRAGWTVLAARAAGLDLPDFAQAVSARLHRPPSDPSSWRRVVVYPWATLAPDEPGLVIYVDALDAPQNAERPTVVNELARLISEIDSIPAGRVRLVVSCESSAWIRIRPMLPFRRQSWVGQEKSFATLTVGDFVEEELDRALASIGAEEFRRADRPRGHADPHVDAMRDILRHPAAFGLFAELRSEQGPIRPDAATTADLAAALADSQIEAASVLCNRNAPSISSLLVKMAEIALVQGSTEFALPVDSLQENPALDTLDFDSTDPASSVVAALVDRGVIALGEATTSPLVLSFGHRDVGVHFLSLHLENAAQGMTNAELRLKLDQWFEDAWTFPPIIDAIIAWANRLARNANRGQFVTIIRALVESDRLRTEVVVRLLSPYASADLILAAKASGNESYRYFPAIQAFRPAVAGLPPLRQALVDPDPIAVRLAAIALGLARDVDAVDGIADLLDHPDDQVRRSATAALGEIGAPAIPGLLVRIQDMTLPVESRARALHALRAVGHRTDEVAPVLAQCLDEPLDGRPGFWSDLLFTAAKLKVEGLAGYAVEALNAASPNVVRGGATLLINSPDASTESALLNALNNWSVSDDGSWVLERVGMAVLQLTSPQARAAFLELVYGGLRTEEMPRPGDTIRLIGKMPSTLGRSNLIAELIGAISFGESSPLFWESVTFTRKAWRSRDLDDIATAAAEVQRDGRRPVERIVDILLQSILSGATTAIAQTSSQIDVVQALVRCQVAGIATQLIRLLPHALDSFLRHLLFVLWVLADPITEGPLWDVFSSRIGEEPVDNQIRLEIVRTLAHCATQESRQQLMDFTKALVWFARGFDEDVLVPLVRRGILAEDDLAEIAEDQEASIYGREASIMSLARLSPDSWASLIRGVLGTRPGARLERECMLALANMGDQATAPLLRDRLQEIVATWPPPEDIQDRARFRTDASVAAVAALGLAVLGDTSVVTTIEEMVDRFPGDAFDLSLLAEALARLKAPSSLPVLLRFSENRESSDVVEAAIQGLGGYLPNADAQEKIVAALNTGSGGLIDRGSQLAAMRTLAHYDANLLLENVTSMSPLGHLDSSARQWLALNVHSIAAIDGVNEDLVSVLLGSLACDLDFWVRETLYQTVDRVPDDIVARVLASLCDGSDSWCRACGTRLLGALEGEDAELEVLRDHPDPIVRDAAEAALYQRKSRRSLDNLIVRFGSSDVPVRTATFFALKERADEWAMWRLSDRYPESTPARGRFTDLAKSIQVRRREEHKKGGKKEDRKFVRSYPFDIESF